MVGAQNKISDRRKARIFARDHYRCVLCDSSIDMALPARHPMSASIDHAIPQVRWRELFGTLRGVHHEANLQAAHLSCNVRKHDRAVVHAKQHTALHAHMNNLMSKTAPTGLPWKIDLTVLPRTTADHVCEGVEQAIRDALHGASA